MPLTSHPETSLLDLCCWLLPGLTPHRLQKLPAQMLDSPEKLLQAAQNLSGLPVKTRELIDLALVDPWKLPFASQLEAHLNWLEHENHWLVPLRQQPELLRQLPDPPTLLLVQGDLRLLEGPNLAFVGSRRLSPEGRWVAQEWSNLLAWQGLGIVSGLARGVDGQAHQGALQAQKEGASGNTLAVLGQGLDGIYPPEHAGLAEEILAWGGALVSEYPLGTPPRGRNFPRRNRIITGLSLGVLVVEATLKSGSLVSARLAMEQNREVMAVPGSIRRQQSQGCHQLIRQGAELVTSPEEVLLAIRQPLQNALPQDLSSEVDRQPAPHLQPLYCLLSDAPLSLDQLLEFSGLKAAEGMLHLQELELEGWIEQQPGGWCRST
ncbi:DNA-processing protein DprA [Marinospirillum perlucidum]|uniref:DNA-processing protein DprA n=1 Tax=Marinospirillum perlucidum TaxID=1982602 RepID=UPI001C499CC7|nr:DNA-processing protein DprA [Marinospirillum perlucidum]